jgi:hypothetical protein
MPAVAQNLKNHTRFDPAFHFFLVPLLLLNLLFSIYYTIHHWPFESKLHLWWIVMSVVLLLVVGLARQYAMKVQDRVIRLEERLRLAALVPASELPLTAALTESQLVALRFASDAELPSLAVRAAAGKLTNKQIKELINEWRPDYFRV